MYLWSVTPFPRQCVSLVQKADVAPFHFSGQKNAVRVLDQFHKSLACPLHNRILGIPFVPLPSFARPINQVRAKDNADVVEFESLRGVDAADLVLPAGTVCPKRCPRDALGQTSRFGFGIPRATEPSDIFWRQAIEDFARLSGDRRAANLDPGTERLTQIIDQFCAFPASLGNEGQHYKLQSLRTSKPSSTDPPQRSNGLEPNIAKLDDDALELEGDRAGAYGDFLDVIFQDAVHVHLDGIAAAEDIVGIPFAEGFLGMRPGRIRPLFAPNQRGAWNVDVGGDELARLPGMKLALDPGRPDVILAVNVNEDAAVGAGRRVRRVTPFGVQVIISDLLT